MNAALARTLGNGQWDEVEHPRDEDGKFTDGGSNGQDAGAGSGRGRRTGASSPEEAERRAAEAASGYAKLEGLPSKPLKIGDSYFAPGPLAKAKDAADAYMKKAGLEYDPPTTYTKVDPERAARIAAEYDKMKHAPDDPAVKASYAALAAETIAQWEEIKKTGLKVEWIKSDDPYSLTPRLAAQDVADNNHWWGFPTDLGYGSGPEAGVSSAIAKTNPMLAETGEVIDGRKVVVNDVFRIVHDYFGHFKEGVGFRADGEENAWRVHASMFSPLARAAMTAETRGQNSWVNYGPYGEKNRTASGTDTVFAPQKIGIMPDWTMNEGRTEKSVVNSYRTNRSMKSARLLMIKNGLPANSVRVSDKLEWVEVKGRLQLRKARIDYRARTITIFIDAIEANRPNDAKQHALDTLQECIKFLGNGEWDEEEHPRDEDGQFTFGGAGGPGDSGDTGEGFGGGLVLPEAKPDATPASTKVTINDFDTANETGSTKIRLATSNPEKFLERWNSKLGVSPDVFKDNFLGGTKAGEVTLTVDGDQWTVSGNLYDGDRRIGDFTRNLHFDKNKAYSAYLSLTRASGKDFGKQVLAGNIETYKKLGFTQVGVSANVEVGGYAWAKYGYVPTQAAWNDLSSDILHALDKDSPRRSGSTSTYTPESWDEIGSDDQEEIRRRWMELTRGDFYDSEVQNWRESGEALAQAKKDIANLYDQDDHPEWALEAINDWRSEIEGDDATKIPFTTDQILQAVSLEYDEDDYEGREDADITFEDEVLDSFSKDVGQGTLPGIEPIKNSERLTQDMRDEIEKALVDAFNSKAEGDEGDIEVPDWISDRVGESQESYWDDGIDDEERFRNADRLGLLPEIEIEDEDSDYDPDVEDIGDDESAMIRRLAQSNDPKSIWAIADSDQGKNLLLGTTWSGVLKLDDEEAMARFNAYVNRSSKKKKPAEAA